MNEKSLEKYKEELIIYKLTHEILNDFLEELKQSIKNNINLLVEVNKEDVKVNKKRIKLQYIDEVIDKYKNSDCSIGNNERCMVIYRGNPYVTLNLCLQALVKGKKIILLSDNFMYGVNNILISILQKELEKIDIFNLISFKNNYSNDDIFSLKEFYNKVIVIGNTNVYQLLREDIPDISYFPYNNISIYCETNELQKLQEAIYIYANENKYEIEVMYNSIKDAIRKINSDSYKNIAILLTQNDRDKQFFKREVKGKDIYINDNPFKKEIGKIYDYLE